MILAGIRKHCEIAAHLFSGHVERAPDFCIGHDFIVDQCFVFSHELIP